MVGMRVSMRRRTMPACIALHEGADAKAPGAAGVDRELALVGLLELLALLGSFMRSWTAAFLRLLRRQRLSADGSDHAVDLDARRSPAVMKRSGPLDRSSC
jgi:hypothetical protein